VVNLLKFKSEISKINDVIRIKIDVPFGVKFVCTYIFEIDGKKVIIDSGLNMGNWSKVFFTTLAENGYSISDVDYCIITHIHTDHIGLIKKFKKKNPDLKLLMHDITHRILKWETDKTKADEYREEAIKVANLMIKYGISEEQGKHVVEFLTLWPNYLQYQEPDQLIHDGEIILSDLKILWTPGHSFGHICIFDNKKGYLFSGDHILSRITPHIGNFVISSALRNEFEDQHFDNILNHYLKSLEKIDNLNPKVIFPAHQDVIYEPHKRIQEIRDHHENRLNEILAILQDKTLTPFKVSQIHFGTELDEINSYMALSEILGHLTYLEYQGRVEKTERNGKYYFQQV